MACPRLSCTCGPIGTRGSAGAGVRGPAAGGRGPRSPPPPFFCQPANGRPPQARLSTPPFHFFYFCRGGDRRPPPHCLYRGFKKKKSVCHPLTSALPPPAPL